MPDPVEEVRFEVIGLRWLGGWAEVDGRCDASSHRRGCYRRRDQQREPAEVRGGGAAKLVAGATRPEYLLRGAQRADADPRYWRESSRSFAFLRSAVLNPSVNRS
jgi:hypothetical protein